MSGLKILVVEDEKSVSDFLKKTLEYNGYFVKVAEDGKSGKQFAIEFRPDIILLDLGLPDITGIELLKIYRTWLDIPIVILTANAGDVDKVNALEFGADDYLTKPFSMPELLARLKAIMRRIVKSDQSIISSAHLDLNMSVKHVAFNKTEIHLTQTEYEILKNLMLDLGKVVVHKSLLKKIWGPNAIEYTQYLRVYVGQLRKKLIAVGASPDIIVTETGVGYRLND
jgi:two-component system KDP operon response regulator KdpE